MRRRSVGLGLLMLALVSMLETCKGRSDDAESRNPVFPEEFPASWDGRTDYAASAFTIQ